MKIKLQNTLALLLSITSFNILAAGQNISGNDNETYCQLTSEQVLIRIPSEEETTNLNFMREEEKLARDVYNALFEQWNTPIFTNISASEQIHMDKVKVFLDAYQLPDSASSEAGQYNDQHLQDLYDTLIAQGNQSELEALKVGALIEEVDIFDLLNAIENTDNDELKTMYTQLMLASHNHLRAFSKQIINLEGEYIAQFMDAEAVSTILNDPKPEIIYGNAILIDSEGNTSANNSCFIGSIISEQQILQNGSTLTSNDAITVTQQVTPNTSDLNQIVDWVIIASFKTINGDQSQFFALNGDNWQAWNGEISLLPFASTSQQLINEYTLPIFQGQLQGLSGTFSIYSGYQLENGSIVYNQFPIVFKVID